MDEYTLNESKEFIKKLKSNKNGYIFLQPIEELVNSLADYKEMIKYPIDLLKIEDKLVNKFEYNTIEDMKNDIDLMVNNCLTYNFQPNSWANKSAVQFKEFFNNNYKKLENKIEKHNEKKNSYLGRKRPNNQIRDDYSTTSRFKGKSINTEKGELNSNINNNITVLKFDDEKIIKRVKNLFAYISPSLNASSESIDNVINILIKGFTKRNKSFDELYDDSMKFINKHLTEPEKRSKFMKKFRKLIRTLQDEQNEEASKMEMKNLNIKIDLNENEEKRQEKSKLEQIRRDIKIFVENQKVPDVFLDPNEYSIEPVIKKKIYNFVMDIRNNRTSVQVNNEVNDLIDLEF